MFEHSCKTDGCLRAETQGEPCSNAERCAGVPWWRSQNSGEEKKPTRPTPDPYPSLYRSQRSVSPSKGLGKPGLPKPYTWTFENPEVPTDALKSSESPRRHPNSQRFHELLQSLGELHDKKQADYGRGDDPFANVRASDAWGMPAWVGAMVRATDKLRRLQTFARKGELANESVLDAFDDLAVYAVIARVLYEEEAALRPDPDEVGYA